MKTAHQEGYDPRKTVIMKAADKTALFEVPKELKATMEMPAYKGQYEHRKNKLDD